VRSKRRRILGGLIIIGLVGLFLYLWRQRPGDEASSLVSEDLSKKTRRPVLMTSNATARLEGERQDEQERKKAVFSAPGPLQSFEILRTPVMGRWRMEVFQQLEACLPTPDGDNVRPITFTLVYDPTASSGTLQQFQVKSFDVRTAGQDVSPEIQNCLNRAVGTTVGIPAVPEDLPDEPVLFHETLALPIEP